MEILRDLSVSWAMFHVIFLFIMLFRSRYTKKKTILLALTGMGLLMGLNMAGLILFCDLFALFLENLVEGRRTLESWLRKWPVFLWRFEK